MRIAIVNDLTLAVEAVRRVVLTANGHQLAWVAHDGAQAVELCAHDTPDLILMDLIMPRMDGVEATRRIMACSPCPIVVVTASVLDHSAKVFEAMGAGALDAVNTPVLESPGAAKGANALLTKIESVRKIVGLDEPCKSPPAPAALAPALPRCQSLVAIGASAGGPGALAKVLGSLPPDFPAPIVVVQHVDPQFAQGLATWLDYQTPLQVRLAQEGDQPKPGTVLLAGREEHLVMANPKWLTYTPQPVDSPYRPSIDVFFKSVHRFWTGDIIGVLLTGMGRDGAEGLRVLHQHDHLTIAQDQGSSAVYGMPKAAAELRAASAILPLNKIGPRLRNVLSHKGKAHA
ncbi:MAG TPA: chemotaxis response regulator protein-glutamate methylesterase [Candidatus Binatia bacterium]|jgi:two-component system response regulator WspF|nr:chemotaxis response regulator protein-glutamate methylesterase [Candidatus Binatia bacterium]